MKLDCTILHVEDDDDDSLFFQRILEERKFSGTYQRVSKVNEAIQYLENARHPANPTLFPVPHILVCDSGLGTGKTTKDLAQWMDQKHEFRATARILLTGDVNPGDQQNWLDLGFAAVLLKGSNLESLAVSVEEILKHCPCLPEPNA